MSYINDTFGRPMFEKQMNPKHESYERLCKSIRDMLKENETLKERIKRLEEAGDAMETRLHLWKNTSGQFICEGDAESVENWNKSKEEKL